MDVAGHFAMARFPAFQPQLLHWRVAVFRGKGQQLDQQTVARTSEGVSRTLETLEELRANEADNLFLAVLGKLVDALIVADVIRQGVIDRQREQRLVLGK